MILIGAMMFLISCSKETNVTTIISPDQVTESTADWMLIAGNWTDPSGKALQEVRVYPINPTSHLNDTLTLKMDNTELPLLHDSQNAFWTGTVNLEPGTTYQFHIFIENSVTNAIQEYDASLQMVYPIDITFPALFILNTSTTLTWSTAHDSQYQQVYVTSTSATNEISEYEKQVASNLRTYTIPANCVLNYGAGSVISVQVNEFNYKQIGRVAFFSAASASTDYPVLGKSVEGKNKEMDKFANMARRFLKK
jgi:hypothetical protein